MLSLFIDNNGDRIKIFTYCQYRYAVQSWTMAYYTSLSILLYHYVGFMSITKNAVYSMLSIKKLQEVMYFSLTTTLYGVILVSIIQIKAMTKTDFL